MNSRNDPHVLASVAICATFSALCLISYLFTAGSAMARDIYVAGFSLWFGGVFLSIGIINTVLNREKIHEAICEWWEYLKLRQMSALGGGRFSKRGVNAMVADGTVQRCAFTHRDGEHPRLVIPQGD